MGQKGMIKMDSNTLAEAVAVVLTMRQGVEDSVSNVQRLIQELDATNVLKGGKPAADIVTGVENLTETFKRVSAITGKVGTYLDKLSVAVDTNLRSSQAGSSARSASEEAQKKVQSVQA